MYGDRVAIIWIWDGRSMGHSIALGPSRLIWGLDSRCMSIVIFLLP